MSDNTPQQQVTVDDPEDLAKTRMLRAVFDERDRYRKIRRKTKRQVDNNELSVLKRWEQIHDQLQNLLMTVEPLFQETAEGRHIWAQKEYKLAYTRVNVPHRYTKRGYKGHWNEGDDVITGLGTLMLDIPHFANLEDGTHTQIKKTSPAPTLCNKAFSDITTYLGDLGLTPSIDEETQTKIDEDLLDEVNQWRQKNV